MRRLPGDLRRLLLVLLPVVLITLSLYGVWTTHTVGMGVATFAFLELVAFEVRAWAARRAAAKHALLERPTRSRRRRPWFDTSVKKER